ncbi:hypothetical protein LTS12_028121, partial [Elasticomyces elasticus]
MAPPGGNDIRGFFRPSAGSARTRPNTVNTSHPADDDVLERSEPRKPTRTETNSKPKTKPFKQDKSSKAWQEQYHQGLGFEDGTINLSGGVGGQVKGSITFAGTQEKPFRYQSPHAGFMNTDVFSSGGESDQSGGAISLYGPVSSNGELSDTQGAVWRTEARPWTITIPFSGIEAIISRTDIAENGVRDHTMVIVPKAAAGASAVTKNLPQIVQFTASDCTKNDWITKLVVNFMHACNHQLKHISQPSVVKLNDPFH